MGHGDLKYGTRNVKYGTSGCYVWDTGTLRMGHGDAP